MPDPILEDSDDRFVMFPIKYQDIWSLYKLQESLFWTAEELDLASDIKDWKSLNDDEKHFIKSVLAFFASSDGIVNENLASQFYSEVKIPEARAFYSMQMAIETVHAETYSLLIDTYITDTKEKNDLFNALKTVPIIKKKADWALKWMDKSLPFAERLFAFACVEGIFFSSSFCSIYWLKDRGKMPGLGFSNELIARDEGIHTDFAVAIHSHLLPENKIDRKVAEQILREAVDIESEFASSALPVSLIGMNCDFMVQHIKSCADRLFNQMGFEKVYGDKSPFFFMEKISLANKTNFHEKKVAEYSKVVNTTEDMNMDLEFDADF